MMAPAASLRRQVLNPGPAACGCKIAAPVSNQTLTLPSAQLSLSRWLQLTGAPRRSSLGLQYSRRGKATSESASTVRTKI